MSGQTLSLLYLVFLVVIFSVAIAEAQEFRFDYDYYQEAGGWLKLHQIPANWQDARLMCAREGSVLASPEDENLLLSIRTILKKLPPASKSFTGIHATYAKGHYYSIEGTPLARMPVSWAPGEPDNAGNAEDCLLMLPEGQMADGSCSLLLPYVCYKRQTPSMAVTICGTVDKDYEFDHRTNSCYKFHPDPQDWSNAFATCSGEGGHLAIINSEVEAQVLSELYNRTRAKESDRMPYQNAMLGFTDLGDHSTWMTIHGQSLKEAGYDKWEGVQPDNKNSHCGAMYDTGLLDDVPCDAARIFICEKNPNSIRTRLSPSTTTISYDYKNEIARALDESTTTIYFDEYDDYFAAASMAASPA